MVRDATIARVADWLGPRHLRTDQAGRLTLGPDVRTDWVLFRELVRRSHDDPTARALLLERALGLVSGPLLSGRPEGRYAWLAGDELEYDVSAEVADAAHRLCELRLAEGDPDAAIAAVRAGLLLATDDESLWRDLLRATHATGDLGRLRAVVEGLTRRSASHPHSGGMAPETEALIDELLPSWRLHVVRESTA
ncbi:bacterial transcriptional activator domain-containing protein [Nonomuraea glycinis]|nr:bacterial transcriptional activator domain-containing protein [Nonomuraea glycinis]